MKICNLCKEWQAATDFYRDKSRPDGLSNRCKKCDNAKRNKHISENLEARRASLRAWREKNKESQREVKRKYNIAYKEKVRAVHGVGPSSVFKRRFKLENGFSYRMGSGDWIEPRVRRAIYERDSWVCHLCDEPVDRDAHWNDDLFPSLDHLIPRSKGGSDDPDNLKTAHRLCNSIRQDTPLVA